MRRLTLYGADAVIVIERGRFLFVGPQAEIPRRFERAEQVFSHKLWREQLREWDEHCKPSSIAATTDSTSFTRAHRLFSASTRVHGVAAWPVFSSISSTARW